MSTRRKRLSALLILLVLVIVGARAGYLRLLGESPDYRPCVAAMERVVPGQAAAEAEANVGIAIAHGAHYPSPDLVSPGGYIPGGNMITCVRYAPDMAGEFEPTNDSRILIALRYLAQRALNGAFHRTHFRVIQREGRVAYVEALDCNEWPIDTIDCRPHGRPAPNGGPSGR